MNVKKSADPKHMQKVLATSTGKRVQIQYDITRLDYMLRINEEVFTFDTEDVGRILLQLRHGSRELALEKRLLVLDLLSRNGANVEAHEADDGAAWVVTWKD